VNILKFEELVLWVTDLNNHGFYVTKLKEREECIINPYNAARKSSAAVPRNLKLTKGLYQTVSSIRKGNHGWQCGIGSALIYNYHQ